MAKQLIMTIGLPFSGKSTLAKEYAAAGWVVIERDKLLEGIIKSEGYSKALAKELETAGVRRDIFKIKNKVAISMLTEAVRDIVINSEGEKYFYDGSNLQKDSRSGIIRLKDDGVEVSGIYLEVPLEVIAERMNEALEDQKRRGEFNERAFFEINKMLDLFQEPKLEEGFSKLEIIGPDPEPGSELRMGKR